MNVARQAALRGRRARRGAGRDREPRVRLRAPGGRARRRGDQGRLHGRGHRGRDRVDEQRALPAEGRALGLPDGQRRGDRLHGGRGADVRDLGLPHGQHRRGSRVALPREPRRPGRVRRGKPAARRGGHCVRALPRRDRAGRGAAEEGRRRCRSSTTSTRAAARRSRSWAASSRRSRAAARVTAGNASGINDGASALVVASEKWARAHGKQPLARVVSYASIGVDPAIMGMGPVPAVQRALERARSHRRGHRPVRAERGVRRAVAGRDARTRARSRRRSTSTAAPSRWATRSARAARAC